MTANSRFYFTSKNYKQINSGIFTWQSPSNIALIKYWGKKDCQIPMNPSLSFTLSNSHTVTELKFKSRKKFKKRFSFKLFFEKEERKDFNTKIELFFERILPYMPFLTSYDFEINTYNSFPHSSGIASSASSMSALALCLMSIEKSLDNSISDIYFKQKASFLARLGSGSACRSVDGSVVVWGFNKEIKESSDLYGVQFPYKIHPNFKNYNDTILLVDLGEKIVSSTVGHKLMNKHPFSQARFKQATENLIKLKDILQTGNLKSFINLVEQEALTLHAMMMTSNPYFILMKPNTLKIIEKIWDFRKKSILNVCFTLDAGANVHVLYPEKEKEEIMTFIKNELIIFCQKEQFICDKMGLGSINL